MTKNGFKETINWYDNNAKNYARSVSDKIPQNQIKEFVGVVKRGGLVLDAGCGAGRDSNLLCKKGLRTIGLDISRGLISEARRSFPKLDFRLQSFIDSGFRDSEFDGIWANLCLVHFEDIKDTEKSLKEFARVLRPNGFLHLVVKERVDRDETEIVKDTMTNHPRFFRFYTEEQIRMYLAENNFKIINIDKYKETDYYPNGRQGEYFIRVLSQKL